jgi:fucose permease
MVDVESADHEQLERVQSELDPLILVQHVVKVPSVQEANVARAQFLSLCWSMFVMGWTNCSTGPLLPRIQVFYGVSSLSWSIVYVIPFTIF